MHGTKEDTHIMLIPIIIPLESGMIGLWSNLSQLDGREIFQSMKKVDIMQEIYTHARYFVFYKQKMNPSMQ